MKLTRDQLLDGAMSLAREHYDEWHTVDVKWPSDEGGWKAWKVIGGEGFNDEIRLKDIDVVARAFVLACFGGNDE